MAAHFTPPEKDHAGEFRSKLVAGNGEIVAPSEGYTSGVSAALWPLNMLRWTVEALRDHVRQEIIDELTDARTGQPRVIGFGPGPGEIADRIIARLTAVHESVAEAREAI